MKVANVSARLTEDKLAKLESIGTHLSARTPDLFEITTTAVICHAIDLAYEYLEKKGAEHLEASQGRNPGEE